MDKIINKLFSRFYRRNVSKQVDRCKEHCWNQNMEVFPYLMICSMTCMRRVGPLGDGSIFPPSVPTEGKSNGIISWSGVCTVRPLATMADEAITRIKIAMDGMLKQRMIWNETRRYFSSLIYHLLERRQYYDFLFNAHRRKLLQINDGFLLSKRFPVEVLSQMHNNLNRDYIQ